MALTEYKRRREFSKTPEPKGGRPLKTRLSFVVQKHAASTLHYDFRLEMEGVLRSWAVPKGPSMNPKEKRLAIRVEDHPFDYRNFEGVIPDGNYGAGTVIVWDRGTYESLEEVSTKVDHESAIVKGFKKGSFKFRLNGKKLKGEFALVKTPSRAKNAWLLIKLRDAFATNANVLEQEASVVSGRTLEEGKADPKAKVWGSSPKKRSVHLPGKARKVRRGAVHP